MNRSGEDTARDALLTAHPTAAKSLSRYVDLLASRGISWGLLGPREGDRLWSRHVANSLALLDLLPEGVAVADVGSGAGLPGIPLALARPDLNVALIEPLLRRVRFLEFAIEEAGISDRVRIVRCRAEDCTERFDIVTCRAVAPLSKLLVWTTPLLADRGALVALKGRSAEAEVEAARNLLDRAGLIAEILELHVVPGVEDTRAVRVHRR